MNIERKIIHLLKMKGPLSTIEIAQFLEISKTCTYRHLASLEGKFFLARRLIKTRIGRPGYKYVLTENGINSLNDERYFIGDFLRFIVRTQNGGIISEFLKYFYESAIEKYESKILPGDIETRAVQLVSLRSRDGYMATLVNQKDEELQIEQANCPIYKIAKIDETACEMERKMYRDLLGQEVELSQKQTCGNGVCRFRIVLNRVEATVRLQ